MTTERRGKASDEAVTPTLDEAVAQVRYRIDQSRTWEGMKYGPPNRKVFVETVHLEVLIAAASRPSPAERDRGDAKRRGRRPSCVCGHSWSQHLRGACGGHPGDGTCECAAYKSCLDCAASRVSGASDA